MDRSADAHPERLREMVFALDVFARSLTVFASRAAAVASVEGLDIAEGNWKFFAADGKPLRASFSIKPRINHDNNTYANGVYSLEPFEGGQSLHEILAIVECRDKASAGLATLRDLEAFLFYGDAGSKG